MRSRWTVRAAHGRAAALCACALLLAGVVPAAHAERPPSEFGPDAPQLAPLGHYAVGFEAITLVQHAQVDVLAYDPVTHRAPKRDRRLVVDVWYPAVAEPRAPRMVYSAAFPSAPPAPPAPFTVPGIAVRGAPFAGANHPLVVVSHGYSNDPVAMSWITENLASKGYVVAAIQHDDPPITDKAKFIGPVMRRPLDIAFVAATLQRTFAAKHWIDPERTALLGYSMGGYGVLTAAGAVLDPHSPAAKSVPDGLLLPYCRGGALQRSLLVAHLRAVVAISPAGGPPFDAWGRDGLQGVHAPLLLINGNRDHTVGYRRAGKRVFDEAIHAPRYLLTFEEGGHDIGLDPAPVAMRSTLWNLGWFQDPVWSTERVNAINAHFITAFLDRYVRGEKRYAAYLDVPVVHVDRAVWPNDQAPYAAYSPGTGGVTVWKGFQHAFAVGLELRQAEATPISR
ncbi:MAG: dienelactone hydrolase [Gammaproteobacteria bacterium]|nr:dienelactone hydrolase [Gammaproteobacteria bacterium]